MERAALKITMVGALSLFLLSSLALADDSFSVSNVSGDAIYREVGEYMWKKADDATVLYSGDRVRIRAGQAAINFPQGIIAVNEQGEVEIPVVLSPDGFAEAWGNDVVLFFGNYDLEIKSGATPLLIKAQYGELIATGNARMKLQITKVGAFVTMLEGSVTIRHPHQAYRLTAGQQASIDPSAIRVETARVASR